MMAFYSIAPWFGYVFLCGLNKMYQFLPRPAGPRKHCSERNHKKRLQLPSMAQQDITINQKIAGKFLAGVWG
jgi:hypothetical protein